MKKEPIIAHMITQKPIRFEVETTGPMVLTGVCISIERSSGKALAIELVQVIDESIVLDSSDEFDE